MKFKIFSSVMSIAIASSLTLPSFASAETFSAPKVSKECSQPLSEGEVTDKYGKPIELKDTDTDMKIALEIAKSDLEEKAVVNKEGFAENFYKNAKDANVSEKAFEEFNASLENLNKGVKNGQYKLGSNISDIKVSGAENSDVAAQASWFISHSKSAKAQKLILAGAGVSLLASELGVPVLVASGLAALAAGAGLCDWNDKGFYLIYAANLFTCVPAF
ncbi:hypothetical protein AB0R79_14885 [Bacillus velezensis]|uniref:hypothetical protein n=1 Tax=Bacillus velezensis TaxID=492670 RepID=UPI0034558D3D